MNWLELVRTIVEVCLIPLLGIITRYFVVWLTVKAEEAKAKTSNETTSKYITMIKDTVSNCVIATNQTYVNALKDKDAFSREAQITALNLTLNQVISLLSEDAKAYIIEIAGDLNNYLKPMIEAEVNKNK